MPHAQHKIMFKKLSKNIDCCISRRKFILFAAAFGTAHRAHAYIFDLSHTGYKILSETIYKPSSTIVISPSLIKTADGGCAFTTHTIMDSDLTKITPGGRRDWRAPWERLPGQPVFQGVTQLRDRSFFVFGFSDSYQLAKSTWGQTVVPAQKGFYTYALLIKFDENGAQIPFQVRNVKKDVQGSTISHAIEVPDGVVFFGTRFLDCPEQCITNGKRTKIWCPWVFKISLSGELLWDHSIQIDNGELIKDVNPSYGTISKPALDESGNIIFATRVDEPKKDGRDGSYNTLGEGNNKRTLIIKISPSGEELARYRNSQCTNGQVAVTKGAIHFFSRSPKSHEQYVFTRLILNSDLRQVSQSFDDSLDFETHSVIPASAPGEFHLLGRLSEGKNERKIAGMGYLVKNGKFKYKKLFDNHDWPGDMISGNQKNEIAIILTGVKNGSIAKLVRLHFSDE